MRMALSAVVLIDIFIRWSDLSAFYTDQGLMPRELLFGEGNLHWKKYSFSVLTISGEAWVQHIFFVLATICAFFVFVGHRTRLFTILTWIWLISVQNRVGVILQSGDDYLRLMFLWAIFLPWGRCYSLDSFEKQKPVESEFIGTASVAMLIQIVSVYFFSALLKNGVEWHSEGSALYYALSIDQMVKPLGLFIYPFEGVLRFLTKFTVFIEYLIPILFLIPWQKAFFRGIGLISIIALHIGIELVLQVGLFSYISIAASLCLIPSSFFDDMPKLIKVLKKRAYEFFENLKYILPYKPPKRYVPEHPVIAYAVVGLVLIGSLWNVSQLNSNLHSTQRMIAPVVNGLGLNQHWGMFAPSVFKDDGWFVHEGISNGKKIDIKKDGAPVDYEKPKQVWKQHKNARWRKLGENLIYSGHVPLRKSYCLYLLRNWAFEYPSEPLDSLNVVYVKETSGLNYKHAIPENHVLCTCQ